MIMILKRKNIYGIIQGGLLCKGYAIGANAPMYFDDVFNEINMEWKEALKLNMQAIDDIVKKYEEDDTIICVTSGVNISAFICYFYKIEPNNNIPYTQACGISPVIFNYKK